MSLKSDCLFYLKKEKEKSIDEFPQNEHLIEELFFKISDFVNMDFEGISDNKIYRNFLDLMKEILILSFEKNASKSFLHNFFKRLNNKKVTDFLASCAKTKATDFKNVIERFVNEFVYWQESDHKKELKLNEIIKLIDGWM